MLWKTLRVSHSDYDDCFNRPVSHLSEPLQALGRFFKCPGADTSSQAVQQPPSPN